MPGFAACYDPIIVVDIALFAPEVHAAHELRQFCRRLFATFPTLAMARAGLIELGRINAMQADNDARHVESIAIGSATGAANVLPRCRKRR